MGGRPERQFRPSELFFRASFTSFLTHSSHLTFFCFFVLFHSCCYHSRVFGKTLLHELHIFYSHTEWYTHLLLSDTCTKENSVRDGETSQSTVTPYKSKLNYFFYRHFIYFIFNFIFEPSSSFFFCPISFLQFPCSSVWKTPFMSSTVPIDILNDSDAKKTFFFAPFFFLSFFSALLKR